MKFNFYAFKILMMERLNFLIQNNNIGKIPKISSYQNRFKQFKQSYLYLKPKKKKKMRKRIEEEKKSLINTIRMLTSKIN